jgi:hypothetical protein
MIQTKHSDSIDDYLAFLEQFGEGRITRQKAIGASSTQIDQFAHLVRYPLPKIYRGYLLNFGLDDTGLDIADDACTKISRLLQFYEEQVPLGYWDVPFLGVVVALPGLTGCRSFIYDEEMLSEPQVAINWGEHVSEAISESPCNWIYQTTFMRFRFRMFGNTGDFAGFRIPGDGRTVLAELAELFRNSEFEKYWFSDSYVYCGEKADLCVCASATPKDVSMMIGGSREASTAMIAKIRRRFDVPFV